MAGKSRNQSEALKVIDRAFVIQSIAYFMVLVAVLLVASFVPPFSHLSAPTAFFVATLVVLMYAKAVVIEYKTKKKLQQSRLAPSNRNQN